ncbi:hypothetical protein SPHINGOT1_120215 [Sphingomonas sp. T1]|nr:hypothetical protein SPHINGOT1_120215 [Sphingomonas sp. T1]
MAHRDGLAVRDGSLKRMQLWMRQGRRCDSRGGARLARLRSDHCRPCSGVRAVRKARACSDRSGGGRLS